MGSVSSHHEGQEREFLAWTNRYAKQEVEKLQLWCVKIKYQQEKHERNKHKLLEFLKVLLQERPELAGMDDETLKKVGSGCYDTRLYMSTKGGELRVMAIYQKDQLKILSDYKDLFTYERLFNSHQEKADDTNVKVDLLSYQHPLLWGVLKSQVLIILRIRESKQEPVPMREVPKLTETAIQQLQQQIPIGNNPPNGSNWQWFTEKLNPFGSWFGRQEKDKVPTHPT